jgi:hypothetical protein
VANGDVSSGRRKLFLLGGGVLAVLIIVTLVLSVFSSPPKREDISSREYSKVAEEFIISLSASSSSKSFNMMSLRLREEEGGPETWKQYHATHFNSRSRNFVLEGAEVVESQDTDKPRTVRFLYDVPVRGGTNQAVAIYVSYIDGSLKVDQYVDTGL